MKYKIGDTVTIRQYIKDKIEEPGFVDNMNKYLGKTAKITDMINYDKYIFYHLDIDKYEYEWSDKYFNTCRIDKLKRILNKKAT